MPNKLQPLVEVFGFPIDNMGEEATKARDNKLCPYNNKVAECTKDKKNDPLGVCAVFEQEFTAITCPTRFRQNWIIVEDAAKFFFPENAKWAILPEVRLKDKEGSSAGNIDLVLVSLDGDGKIIDFGAVEVQGVYISGNVRNPFEYYMKDPAGRKDMNWRGQENYPGPDYLSSSRKRLAPQLIFKGGILNSWKKKVAVVLDQGFFDTLPTLKEVPQSEAEIGWFIYDLELDARTNRYTLVRKKKVYTKFAESLEKITRSEPGKMEDFVESLGKKLKKQSAPKSKKPKKTPASTK